MEVLQALTCNPDPPVYHPISHSQNVNIPISSNNSVYLSQPICCTHYNVQYPPPKPVYYPSYTTLLTVTTTIAW
jgi:hypothetical protein